jgi:general stress protein YciG
MRNGVSKWRSRALARRWCGGREDRAQCCARHLGTSATAPRIAVFYAVIPGIVTALNYIPGLTDSQGRAFGILALDIYPRFSPICRTSHWAASRLLSASCSAGAQAASGETCLALAAPTESAADHAAGRAGRAGVAQPLDREFRPETARYGGQHLGPASLAGTDRAVRAQRDGVDSDVRAMLDIIGIRFTAEMAVKELYEKCIGNLIQWRRGADRGRPLLLLAARDSGIRGDLASNAVVRVRVRRHFESIVA